VLSSDGELKFGNLNPGVYEVICTHPNYKRVSLEVIVNDWQTIDCKGELYRKSIAGFGHGIVVATSGNHTKHVVADGHYQIDGLILDREYEVRVFGSPQKGQKKTRHEALQVLVLGLLIYYIW
jgi:hypothetical protein